MEFHTKTGTSIALSFGNMFAERTNADQTYYDATLFSSKPLADEQLFEVELREKVTQWNHVKGFMVGLTAHNPISVSLPAHGLKLPSSWIFYNGNLYVNGVGKVTVAQANFDDNLAVGSRVGVLRRASGALHLYINGVDQGSFIATVPASCFAVVDLYGNFSAVALIDSDTTGMVSIKLEPWQIPGLKNLMETSEPGFSISSDCVQHKVLPGIEWFLKVYPNGYEEANAHVAVELCIAKSDKKSSATAPVGKFSISVASDPDDGNGSPPLFSPRVKIVSTAGCVSEKFASHEAIGRLCGDGSLMVSVEVFVETPFSMHFAYLRQLFESGAFSDFNIKVENSSFEVAVHKGIIGAASSVMMRMLNSEYGESKEHEMTIKETSTDAVKAMLQFVYGDPLCFDNLEQLSIDVLKLSEQYDLDELKGMCGKALGGMVTKENALQLAELGYLCNASELKMAVSQFIFDNKEITSQDAWMDLRKRHSELIIDIIMFVNSKLYEALSKK